MAKPGSGPEHAPRAIAPTAVRYIKLGPGGAWFAHALANDLIELGHASVSDRIARTGDIAALRAAFVAAGFAKNAAAFANEVAQFVTLPPSTLWITFQRGLMWWAFAAGDLIERRRRPRRPRPPADRAMALDRHLRPAAANGNAVG